MSTVQMITSMAFVRLWCGVVLVGVAVAQTNLYVDCAHGSDSNGNGSESLPWATLTHARNYIRTIQPIVEDVSVNVFAGDCYPTDPASGSINYTLPLLQLTSEDSGNPSASIIYRANTTGSVRLLSGIPIDSSSWQPSGPSSPQMYQLNLVAAGAQAFGYGTLGGWELALPLRWSCSTTAQP
jgi:hypothetical protein